MTKDQIIAAVRESRMSFHLGQPHQKVVDQLTRFAAVVEATEREACAKVCDDKDTGRRLTKDFVAQECAAAIRARVDA